MNDYSASHDRTMLIVQEETMISRHSSQHNYEILVLIALKGSPQLNQYHFNWCHIHQLAEDFLP